MALMQMHCKQRISSGRASMAKVTKVMVIKEKITMERGIKVKVLRVETKIKVHKVIKVIKSPTLNQEETIMDTRISI